MSIQKSKRRTNGLIWKVVQDTLPRHKSYYVSVCEVARSCPTLCDPMDCSLPPSMGFSRQQYWNGLPETNPNGPQTKQRECKHEDSGKGVEMSTRNQHARSRENKHRGGFSLSRRRYIHITCYHFFTKEKYCIYDSKKQAIATSLTR